MIMKKLLQSELKQVAGGIGNSFEPWIHAGISYEAWLERMEYLRRPGYFIGDPRIKWPSAWD